MDINKVIKQFEFNSETNTYKYLELEFTFVEAQRLVDFHAELESVGFADDQDFLAKMVNLDGQSLDVGARILLAMTLDVDHLASLLISEDDDRILKIIDTRSKGDLCL